MYTRIRKLFVNDVVLGCKTCCFIKVNCNCERIIIRSMEVGGAQRTQIERKIGTKRGWGKNCAAAVQEETLMEGRN